MTSTSTPTTAGAPADLDSYERVHRALRETATELAAAIKSISGNSNSVKSNSGTNTPSKAMRRWYRGFAAEIRCHHHIEDELLFPALAGRVATYDQYGPTLTSDHDDLDQLLDRLAMAMGDERATSQLPALTAELRDHLDQHLGYEDTEIVPLFARHFTSEEFESLNQQAIRMTSPKQLVFTAPWLMSRLSPTERSQVLTSAGKPLHVLWFLTRRRYARLVRRAFAN